MEKEKDQIKKARSLSTENIIGIVLIAIFFPIIIFNMSLFIKGIVDPSNIPMIFGHAPLIVESDSMSKNDVSYKGGAFNKGDLIIIRKVAIEDLVVDEDIITYVDDYGKLVTHRLIRIDNIEEKFQELYLKYTEAELKVKACASLPETDPVRVEAETAFKAISSEYNIYNFYRGVAKKNGYTTGYITVGDYGYNPNDPSASKFECVFPHRIKGEFVFAIPLLGSVISFFKSIPGIIILIVLPVGIYFGYEMISRAKKNKNSEQKIAELEAKLAKQNQEEASKAEDNKAE